MKCVYKFYRTQTMPKTSFLLSEKTGADVDYFPRYQRGNNKGKQYVVLREMLTYRLQDKYPFCLTRERGKMITGLIPISDTWFYGNTRDGKYTLAVRSDFQTFIDVHFLQKNGDDFLTATRHIKEIEND